MPETRGGKTYYTQVTNTPEEIQKELAPITALTSSGQYRDIKFDPVTAYKTQGMALEDVMSKIKGTPVYDPAKGPQIDIGQGPVQLPKGTYDFSRADITMGVAKAFSPHTITKDQFAETLAKGSDPANTPANVERSTGYQISQKIASLIPQKQALSPDAGAPFPGLSPTPPEFDATKETQRLATAYGLDTLNEQGASIDAQIEKIQSDLIAKQGEIASQGVSSRVMSKEVSVETKKANAMLRDLRLQKSEITRQISVANKGISMMMSAEKTDFNNAKALWNNEYNKNIQYYNSLDKESTAQDKQDKATLQNMLNMLGTGKTNIDDLTPDAHNTIDELIMRVYGSEFLGLQNELPGGTAIYRKAFTGADGKKYLQSLYAEADGTYRTEYTTPSTQKTTGGDKLYTFSPKQKTMLQSRGLDPNDANSILADIQAGHDLESIRQNMKAGGIDPGLLDDIMKIVDPIHNQ